MKFEVEQKFRVAELAAIRQRAEELGARFAELQVQVDRYFAHPSRDFVETDEAVRVRRINETNRITYKGPRLDRQTKTRREIELDLPAGESYLEEFCELLMALGFQVVAEVAKRRQVARIAWNGADVEISLDSVDEVGEFVEVEVIAQPDELKQAQENVQSLAAKLGIADLIQKSYLELLLDNRATD